MKRIEAIENIMQTVKDEDIIISSCGKISREVFYVKDRPQNFYVMGSMGASLGIGIAICKPNSKVIVIAGDGEILMGLGSLILLKKLQKLAERKGIEEANDIIAGDLRKANNIIEKNRFNLDLYILDNNQYESTGGQPTCSDSANFRLMCDCKVIFCKDSEVEVPRINIEHKEITRRFMHAIKE